MLSLTTTARTPWHRVPPGVKLLVLSGFTVAVFFLDGLWWQLGAVALVAAAHLPGGARLLRDALIALRPLALFLGLLLGWHLLTGSLPEGLAIALRIVAVVGLANLVTMTTRLDAMIALVLRLAAPLRQLGVPVGAVGLAIAMVIRFTPRMMDLRAQLSTSWQARAVRRPGWRIAVPVTLAALDDADHVAEALRARGGVPKG